MLEKISNWQSPTIAAARRAERRQKDQQVWRTDQGFYVGDIGENPPSEDYQAVYYQDRLFYSYAPKSEKNR